MPRLSVWMIRAALLYLGVGFTFGALMLANKGVAFDARIWLLRPVHIEVLIFGWLVQLALGVAFWILPRFAVGADAASHKRYGKRRLVWVTFIALNSGILAVALSTWQGGSVAVAFVGRILELAAVITFVLAIWARVKPIGAQQAVDYVGHSVRSVRS